MYEILKDKNMRYQYCQKDFITFCIYYFPEYFTYNLSDKHKQYMNSLRWDNNVFICGFREFGKTVIAKLYIIWCICYKKYRNIMIYGYEQDKSKDILFDMITILQSNVNIINDFGNIYNSDRTRRKSEKKTILEFITNNQIRVKAMSIGKSPRWDVFGSSDGQYRPDLILLDDIDVTKSVQNEKIIEYNYNRLRSEVFGWLAQDKHKIVFLGNVINEDWVVPRIYNQYPKRDRYRIPIIDDDNNIIRPQRYKQEDIQRLQDQQWDIWFAQNFLLKPYTGQGIVKRWWIRYTNLKQYDKGYDKIIIWVDPASSTKEISDWFAIVVCGHHKYGKDT